MNALAQPDLFIVAVRDAPQRDVLDLMAVPICALSKGGRREPIRFKRGDVSVEVRNPASVYDLDIVLWAVSQMAEAVRDGREVSATVTAPAYNMLRAIGRATGGKEYSDLREALRRLAAATIFTTVRTSRLERETGFHLVEKFTWTESPDGKLRDLAITLPDWIFQAVVEGRMLATDARYFSIKSTLGRALYRIARKQAGDNQTGWRWTMRDLHERTGSTRALKAFAYDVRQLAERDDLPEYALSIFTDQTGAECLHAVRRSKLALDHPGREGRLPRRGRHPA